jgi:uncharacterized protein
MTAMTSVAGIALAALIGLTLGLLGGGGSILTVPTLVYVLGFGTKEAIVISLGVVGTVSLLGTLSHWRRGNVNLSTAALFGAFAMSGAFLGAHLSVYLSGAVQLVIFAVIMLLAAASMLRGQNCDLEASRSPRARLHLVMMALAGVGVGVLTGLVGVGGGFLVVPALVLLARVPMKQAVGTSLLVIAMNSAAGLAGYSGSVHVPWAFMGLFTGVAAAGAFVGTYLIRFASQQGLKRAFAVLLVIMGGFILYQNRYVVVATLVTPRVPVASGRRAVIDAGSAEEPRGVNQAHEVEPPGAYAEPNAGVES